MTPPFPASDLQTVLDALPDPCFAVDADWRFVWVNAPAAAFVGRPGEAVALLGRRLWDEFPEARETPLYALGERVMASREAERIVTPYAPVGAWIELHAFPLGDGIAVHYRDVTAARRAEELADRLRARNDELAARHAALEAFARLTHELAAGEDPLDLVGRTQAVVLELLPPGAAVYSELDGDVWRPRRWLGDLRDPALRAAVEASLPRDAAPGVPKGFETLAPGTRAVSDRAEHVGTEHVGAVANVPVVANGRTHGVFGVALFGEHFWTAAERRLLEAAVNALGLALERVGALAELHERQRELEAANANLNAFADSVSHDLRAPVRHIAGFAGLLRSAAADERARTYAAVIERSASRMNALIDSLLAFARSGAGELRREPVDLGRLVREARAELGPEAEGARVRWRVAPLPTVPGDPDLLRQVFVNLLSNALKYSRAREEARIEVWAEREAGEHALHVRDNGAGFDPALAPRLFGLFQRLHREDEFEGTGVGLANVRRVVERHGGRVWADGTPGGGATFSFTLPA